MSAKTPKPLVMWANPSEFTDITFLVDKRKADFVADWSAPNDPSPIRVAVIPLDDIEAIVERAAKVLLKVNGVVDWEALHETGKLMWRHSARAALTAAGIPCRKRKARK